MCWLVLFFTLKTAYEMRISDWSSDVFSADLRGRSGAGAIYRPILVGGVFNAVNPAVYAAREQADDRKLDHSWKILKDWARLATVPMNFPSQWHPAKRIPAMRFSPALEHNQPAPVPSARPASHRHCAPPAQHHAPAGTLPRHPDQA